MIHDEMYTRLLSYVLVSVDQHRLFFLGIEQNETFRMDGKKTKRNDSFERFVFVCMKQKAKYILVPTVQCVLYHVLLLVVDNIVMTTDHCIECTRKFSCTIKSLFALW